MRKWVGVFMPCFGSVRQLRNGCGDTCLLGLLAAFFTGLVLCWSDVMCSWSPCCRWGGSEHCGWGPRVAKAAAPDVLWSGRAGGGRECRIEVSSEKYQVVVYAAVDVALARSLLLESRVLCGELARGADISGSGMLTTELARRPYILSLPFVSLGNLLFITEKYLASV